MSDKIITVAEIAKQARVSSATVSRVLNHPELVKEATVKKVEQAMQALGAPRNHAQTARSSQRKTIIMNAPLAENLFFSDVIRGAKYTAESHGYDLLISWAELGRGSIDRFCVMLRNTNAAGVILCSYASEDFLDRINEIVPVIQCCEFNPNSSLPYVSIDDFSAAQVATEHLIACGRNKLAMVNGPQNWKYARERQAGFLATMQRHGLTAPSQWMISLPANNFELAYSAICHLLNSDQIPNGIFAVADVYATAAIRAAKRYALSIPNQLMVVGFDNLSLSLMSTPTITTIAQPRYQMGFTACSMLLERIADPDAMPKPMLLETELIVRESTTHKNIQAK